MSLMQWKEETRWQRKNFDPQGVVWFFSGEATLFNDRYVSTPETCEKLTRNPRDAID